MSASRHVPSVRAASPEIGDTLAGHVRAHLEALDPSQGEDALAKALAPDGEVVRWRPYRAVAVLRGSPLGPLHAKVYLPKDALDRFFGLLFRSRGVTSWRMALALRAAGLPTPEPLLLIESRPLRGTPRTVLVTRLVPARLLLDVLRGAPRSGAGSRRRLLGEVARLAAALHDAGFFHGDLTPNNVLVAGEGPPHALWLTDLDRTKDLRLLPSRVRRAVQIVDMRMLLLSSWRDVSRPEWLRLLAEYLRARRLPRAARKRIAARVLSARRGRIRLGARPRTGPRVPWSE